MQITGQLSPAVDNTKSLGASGFRWTAVWASNGTIQTSDPALKTDIAPLPASLPLLMAIHPITFRWIDGGAEDGDSDAMMEVDEDREMQATETASEEIEQVEMVNGRPVLRRVMQTTERPVFDSFPVLDANGNPVTVKMRVGAELRDVPRFHQVPRMERRSVKVVRPATAPGRRTHWGFSAPEVKAAFDALGMDFGGYVKAQDGSQHLRPDQLIPVLWQVCRELADKVAALEAAASR
ncbi:MAG TPA: tail fiber domain-containing protein [Mycobacterium sp.]